MLKTEILFSHFLRCWHIKYFDMRLETAGIKSNFFERGRKNVVKLSHIFLTSIVFFVELLTFTYLAFSVLRFLIAKQTYNILIGRNSVCNWIQKFILLKNLHTTIKEFFCGKIWLFIEFEGFIQSQNLLNLFFCDKATMCSTRV